MSSGSRRRVLSYEERVLWTTVTKAIEPLHASAHFDAGETRFHKPFDDVVETRAQAAAGDDAGAAGCRIVVDLFTRPCLLKRREGPGIFHERGDIFHLAGKGDLLIVVDKFPAVHRRIDSPFTKRRNGKIKIVGVFQHVFVDHGFSPWIILPGFLTIRQNCLPAKPFI